jgi:ABC-2 type transport system ATP-binding protein
MIIEVKDLIVDYKGKRAVDSINFSVKEGEIFGMIGPNGAGKTSTIECIEGLKEGYSGTISILGLNPKTDRKKLYNLIGVQLQETSYQDKIKVWEICKLFSSFYKNPLSYEKLLHDFELHDHLNSYVSKLSGGQKQKVSIILSLISNPKIVFLDELTSGLDPQARRSMWELIKGLRNRGITIYMTTHFMEEAEYLCDRISIMKSGRIVAIDTVNNLINSYKLEEKIMFSSSNLNTDGFKGIEGVNKIEKNGNDVIIHGQGINLLSHVINYLNTNHVVYSNLQIAKPNLEDVFLKINGNNNRNSEVVQ